MPVRMDRLSGLRQRLEWLDGLPLRPASVRLLLEPDSPALDRQRRRLLPLDPGWVLAELTGRLDAVGSLGLVRECSWWHSTTPDVDQALDRLWRHAATTARAADRLAVETGIGRPEPIARIAFLHHLGLWALASLAPEQAAALVRLTDPIARRQAERDLLGTDLETLGRDLADRWGAPTLLAEAAWLHRATSPALAGQPGALRLIQQARAWAERTPWALDPAPTRTAIDVGPPDDDRVRLLVAQVQADCAAPFHDRQATRREEELSRAHARLLQDHAALLERSERLSARLERVGDTLAPRPALALAEPDHHRLEALAEFAAGAAHELNNPLAVILGRAQLLLARPALTAEESRSLRAIITQTQRAHRILRDLIYLARPPVPRPRACLPAEVIKTCLRDLQPEADLRNLRVEAALADDAGPAWMDPDPLRHLVEVLLRNAFEATPAGGTIGIEAGRQAHTYRIRVRDTGPGLSDREARHLFDPFFCGRQAGRGLGLGLARVVRFLEVAGGRLRWGSQAGQGTTFEVALPFQSPPGQPAAAPAVPAPRAESA